MESLENGLQSGVTPLFSMRTVSLASLQYCRSVYADAWWKWTPTGHSIDNSTAWSWNVTTLEVAMIWICWTDEVIIEAYVKTCPLSRLNSEIHREVVDSISTRGHCEQPGEPVINMVRKESWQQFNNILSENVIVLCLVITRLGLHVQSMSSFPYHLKLISMVLFTGNVKKIKVAT